VAVVVANRKRAVDWYTKKLGLEVLDRMGHWVTVGRKGETARLHICQVRDFSPTAPLEHGTSGINFHLAGDFEASCAALKARGVRFRGGPKKEAWGWWATIQDPDGNVIDLRPED
jgi:catechol 2,3-dioxygenase-like lactoylglutathione lyase family enzyme